MRGWLAILFTIGLLATGYVISALIYFDVIWVLVWLTSLWTGIDSAKIQLNRYKLGFACRPLALFCLCALFWIFIFPWYLWARYKIKSGTAVSKEEAISNQRPIRLFFRKLSKKMDQGGEWVLIALVGLKIIFLLFCLEECWRGPRTWDNYRHKLEAKGETFDWDAMIPPPVPDSQNVFSAPMMSEWFIRDSGKGVKTEDLYKRFKYTNSTPAVLVAELIIEPSGSNSNSGKADLVLRSDDPASNRQANELIQNVAGLGIFGAAGDDILAIQPLNTNQFKPLRIFLQADKTPAVKDLIAFFSYNDNNSSAALGIRPDGTNSFQVLASFCSVSDYLKWSDQFKGEFGLMREALKRPYARMKGNYQSPLTMPSPNFVTLRAVARTLAQRAQCYFLIDQPEKALQELTLVHDLCRLLEAEPTGKPMTLVAAMINVGITGLYTDTIADGFRLHAWREPQLVILQQQLSQINLAPILKESFHGEQVTMWCITKNQLLPKLEIPRLPNATLWQKIRNVRPPNIIRGFVYLNMLTVVKMEQKIIDSIDPVQKVVLRDKAAEFEREHDALERLHAWQLIPYKLLASIAVPNGIRAIQKFARIQTEADEAQIVCALERCRLANGKYPVTLDELVPKFIEKLPHDIIGGQQLKYRFTTDGHFMLYSIGWNETDDHGKSSSFSNEQGDWVWQ